MSTQSNEPTRSESLRKLEALFGGTGEPKLSRSSSGPRQERQVFSNPRKSLGRAPSEYRLRLERLRIAREPEEITEAANAFLEHHQLPDDAEILVKVLLHPSERVLREAMGQISALLMQDRLASTVIIEDRLRDLEQRVEESSTLSYIEGVKSQIQKLKN